MNEPCMCRICVNHRDRLVAWVVTADDPKRVVSVHKTWQEAKEAVAAGNGLTYSEISIS